MKIILSPSKLQRLEPGIGTDHDPIFFPAKTAYLVDQLQKKSSSEIASIMKIKGKLLDETIHLYDSYDPETKNHAVSAYNGIVFQEIETQLLDPMQLDYLNHHVRILSALYGVTTPFTGITPYRLDMTMKPDQMNLYDYWKEEVHDHFDQEDCIVNLASLEFSKMVSKGKKDKRMFNIHFKEEQRDGRLKVVTVRAKKARGLMTHYMAHHMIEQVVDLKNFDDLGYVFSEDHSDDQNYTFIQSFTE